MIKSKLLILTAAFATGALAEPPRPETPPRSEQIMFTDLNLAQAAAQATLQERIRAAADRVCDLGGMQALDDFSMSSLCYRRAVADGYRQLGQVLAANRAGAVLAASAIVLTAK